MLMKKYILLHQLNRSIRQLLNKKMKLLNKFALHRIPTGKYTSMLPCD